MKSLKCIALLLLTLLPLGMIGQTNFSFNSPAFSPRPMSSGGDGVASFEVGIVIFEGSLFWDYAGDGSLPATQFVVEFSKVKLKNGDISLIAPDLSGTLQSNLLNYYKIEIMNNGNLLFSQNKDIPEGANHGLVGRLNIPVTAIGESTISAPGNGFKVIPWPGTDPDFPFNDTFVNFTSTSIDAYTYTTAVCKAGSIAPTLNDAVNYQTVNNSYKIPCGTLTADLSGLKASNAPAGTSISWHSGATASATNKVSPVTAITGATKKVYASFYDAAAGCYSPTKEITIYAPICALVDDYTSTTIIEGVGATLPSIYKNDTYNGIDISTTPGAVAFNYEIWVPSNGAVDPNTGVLTIPASTPAGIYEYTYKICDIDSDAVVNSNCASAKVIFKVSKPLVCYKSAVTSGSVLQSITGISNLKGQASDPNYWINNMPANGALVIGSQTKGFVITRIANPEAVFTTTTAVKGMLVFDTAANCLKMYNGTKWFCLTQKCVDN